MQSSEISIAVINPQQKSEVGGVNKYFVYTVKGQDHQGQILIVRRYSDFSLARDILLKRWPGLIIPPLPQKKTIGSAEQVFIQSRRRGLQRFLVDLASSPTLWNSTQIQIFLRNNNPDHQKQLGQIMKESTLSLAARYKEAFPKLVEASLSKQSAAQFLLLSTTLAQTKTMLDKLTEMADKIHESSRKTRQKKLNLLEFVLPDYEKNCLLQNDQKKRTQNLLFLQAKNNGIEEAVSSWKKGGQFQPTQRVQDEIRRERRYIQAFEEAMKIRQDIQARVHKATAKVKDTQLEGSKIQAGNVSFFSRIKKTDKEELASANKRDVQKLKEEEDSYIVLCNIVNNMLLESVEAFRKNRQKAYYLMLKHMWSEERRLNELQAELWAKVGRHDNIGLEQQNKLLKKAQKSQDNELKPKETSQQSAKSEQKAIKVEQVKETMESKTVVQEIVDL